MVDHLTACGAGNQVPMIEPRQKWSRNPPVSHLGEETAWGDCCSAARSIAVSST